MCCFQTLKGVHKFSFGFWKLWWYFICDRSIAKQVIISGSTSCNSCIWYISSLYKLTFSQSRRSAHSISHHIQKSANLSQDVMIYRKCEHLQWKIFRNHNFLARCLLRENKEFPLFFFLLNHNLLDVSFTAARPLRVPSFPALSPLSPLCFFTLSLVRLLCLKFNLPRQAVWVLRLLLIH